MNYLSTTVGDLKQMLEGHDDDTEVIVGCPYGDRAGTIQAVFLDDVDIAYISKSAYSTSGYKVTEEPVDDDSKEVLLLNWNILY